jgi:hypothetical protein
MVALAGIVHDREAAAGHEHNRAEDNQQGSLHVDECAAEEARKEVQPSRTAA